MGAVYYAEHVVLARPAAIKVLLPHIASDDGQVQRFINEARIAAHMNHRNVVDVLDCGMFQSPHAANAQWYIALEYLRGVSLRSFIAESAKPIDLPTIVHVVGEAANGLHAAHERHELVHRDVKPDNLFLIETEDDPLRVKVLDFGIAKLRPLESGVQTRSHAVMGTPAYASPEQLRASKGVDARADVWALGVVAHEMLTGVRPWGAALSTWEIITHHAAMRAAPDPRQFRADVPAKVAAVVSRAMEPDPERRWRSTRDFARALADAAPMPFSGSGMAILERYAPELVRSSSHSLTAGREPPHHAQINPAEIVTGSKGTRAPPLPRMPGEAPGWRDPELPGPETRTISTLGAASGQAIFAKPWRRRAWVVAGGAAIGVVSVVVALMYSWSPSDGRGFAPPEAAGVVDAGATAALDAVSMSTLTIVSNPDGATIFIDGAPRGSAPLNAQLPVGSQVEIRAALPGRDPARRLVAVTAAPVTVRFEFPPAADAGATIGTPPAATPPKGSRDGGRGSRKPSSGSAAGRGSDRFDATDVL